MTTRPGRRLAVHRDVVVARRGCWAAARAASATAPAASSIRYARVFPFFTTSYGRSFQRPSWISFAFCRAAKTPTGSVRGRAVRLEVRRRRVLEVRHVHRRRAVERVERHVERVPRPGELEAGVPRRVDVLRDRHLVVEPPAPLAVAAEEVVDEPLDDLAEGPRLPAHRVLERLVPARPGVLLRDRRGRREERRGARSAPRRSRGAARG